MITALVYSWLVMIIGVSDLTMKKSKILNQIVTMKRYILVWFLGQVNANCADKWIQCNGVKECVDGRDEIGCPNFLCVNPSVSSHKLQLNIDLGRFSYR